VADFAAGAQGCVGWLWVEVVVVEQRPWRAVRMMMEWEEEKKKNWEEEKKEGMWQLMRQDW